MEVSDHEFDRVAAIAERLHAHLNTRGALAGLAAANLPRTSSAAVQAVFRPFAIELGFVDERRGLFAGHATSALRPDYFLRLGTTGILLEVERGKTITNNMDLLDFWKCHLCVHAHYLFLLVPRALQHNPTMRPIDAFSAASKRLATFFTPGNATNVRGLFLFGY